MTEEGKNDDYGRMSTSTTSSSNNNNDDYFSNFTTIPCNAGKSLAV